VKGNCGNVFDKQGAVQDLNRDIPGGKPVIAQKKPAILVEKMSQERAKD
jgi:hypothetical protein